jgi:hypothetical protein
MCVSLPLPVPSLSFIKTPAVPFCGGSHQQDTLQLLAEPVGDLGAGALHVHPDTQAIFTSVASLLMKSGTIPEQWLAFPSMSRFLRIPRAHNCYQAVLLSV